MISKKVIMLGLLLAALLFITTAWAAQSTKLAVYGTADDTVNGDVGIKISTQASCITGIIYDYNYTGALINHDFNILLGVAQALSLNYNQDYYMCVYIGGLLKTSPINFRGGQGQILDVNAVNDSNFTNLAVSGNAFLINVNVAKDLNTTVINVNNIQATVSDIVLQAGGVARWRIRRNNIAETGLNTGSDFTICARTDAGGALRDDLYIRRFNGFVGLGNNTAPLATLDVKGTCLISSTLGVTGTATFDGGVILDNTSTNALLIRKNAVGIQVFRINTTSPAAYLGGILGIAGTNGASGVNAPTVLDVQGGTSATTVVAPAGNGGGINLFAGLGGDSEMGTAGNGGTISITAGNGGTSPTGTDGAGGALYLGAGTPGTGGTVYGTIFLGLNGGKIMVGNASATPTNLVSIYSAGKIDFRDNAITINSNDDGHLDLTADISIDLNADVNITNNLKVNGDLNVSGTPYFDGNFSIKRETDSTIFTCGINAVGDLKCFS